MEDNKAALNSFCHQENVADVKARLQEEGREARNLIAYSLPLRKQKNNSNNDKVSKANLHLYKPTKKVGCDSARFKQSKRHRSASAGRNTQASLRARHWAFLFRNLEQAVSEIYETAETDESVIECKEAILMLERYTSDFYKLIEWLNLKWSYENVSAPNRPRSVAWEIRTTSPWKLQNIWKSNSAKVGLKKLIEETLKEENNSVSLSQKHSPAKSKKLKLKRNRRNSSALPTSDQKSTLVKPSSVIALSETPKVSSGTVKINENTHTPETISISQCVSPSGSLKCDSLSQTIKSQNDKLLNNVSYQITNSTPENSDIRNKISNSNLMKRVDNNETIVFDQSDKDVNNKDLSTISTESSSIRSGKESQELKSSNARNLKLSSHISKEKTERKHITGDSEHKSIFDQKTGSQKSPNQRTPVPQVNMNKASEVRKAYNQNRAPGRTSAEKASFGKRLSGGPSPGQTTDSKASLQRLNGQLSGSKEVRQEGARHSLKNRQIRVSKSNSFCKKDTQSQPKENFVRSATTLDDYSKRKKDKCESLESGGKSTSSASTVVSTPQSWADKVRDPLDSATSGSLSEITTRVDDDEGWEVVRRHRRSHGNSLSSVGGNSTTDRPHDGHRIHQKRGSFTFRAEHRFDKPSPTLSMPSLCTGFEESGARPKRVTSVSVCNDSDANQKMKSVHVTTNDKKSDLKQRKNIINTTTHNRIHEKTPPKTKPENSVFEKNQEISKKSTNDFIKTDKAILNSSESENIITKSLPSHSINNSSLSPNTTDPDKNLEKADTAIDKFKPKLISKKAFNSNKTVKLPVNESKSIKNRALAENKHLQKQGNKNGPSVISGNKQVEVKKIQPTAKQRDKTDENISKFSETDVQEKCEADSTLFSEPNIPTCCQDSSAILQTSSTKHQKSKTDVDLENSHAESSSNGEIYEYTQQDKLGDNIDLSDVLESGSSSIDGESLNSGDEQPEDEFYHYETSLSKLSSLSWADQMDAMDTIKSIRPPGRALYIHEKLSSPLRKLSQSEKFKRHQEKLAKAQELRGKLILAKTEKLKGIFRKIDEVNTDKERMLSEKRDQFERKMERAEENRRSHLREIINKAHDEEKKAKEIAFINVLEAQNKLLDIRQQHESHESRLADMAEERCRKQEEKAAKEAAAQERRKAIEAERQARMQELWEKRCEKFERIGKRQAEKKEELLEQAREKARDREERLSALLQAQQAKETELVKKIQQKQEDTARRYDENIEQIRRKALESSILSYSKGSDEAPQIKRYETKKLCTICNSMICSEVYLLSHLRGSTHQAALNAFHKSDVSREESGSYNVKFIVDAPANIDDPQAIKNEERLKSLKKRQKKLRNRLLNASKSFLNAYSPPEAPEMPLKKRIGKCLSQIAKIFSSQDVPGAYWESSDITALDRNAMEIYRIMEKGGKEERQYFASLKGFDYVTQILDLHKNRAKISSQKTQSQPSSTSLSSLISKSLLSCVKLLASVASYSEDNNRYLLKSHILVSLVDVLLSRFVSLEEAALGQRAGAASPTPLPPYDINCVYLMKLLSQILGNAKNDTTTEAHSRLQDAVSYCVCAGVTDKISWYFNQIQSAVEGAAEVTDTAMAAMRLLSDLTAVLAIPPAKASKKNAGSNCKDPTQLLSSFQALDACGVVSLLYGLLLHQGGRSASPPASPILSDSTLEISTAATTFLINLATFNLQIFQSILGSEGISLEFRHIASFLFWYCSFWPCEELLHNVIILVGFFAVNNKENQSIIQSGETPSVLQQMCDLPWQYFSDNRLMDVLFPSLLACCMHHQDNMTILNQEMSFQILEDYLNNNENEDGNNNYLLRVLKNVDSAK